MRTRSSIHRSAVLALLLVLMPLVLSGCWIPVLIGGMAESYKETSTHAVDGEYTGLAGKSFAVIVYVDRVLMGLDYSLAPRLTNAITNELAQPERTKATGVVPANLLFEFQFSRPDWVAWSYQQLAEEFGVDRLVVVELIEYRLHEPGNSYLWSGIAAGSIGVVEADGPYPNEFAFTKEITVDFPDQEGLGPFDLDRSTVRNILERRFIDRVTWLFYRHQEPFYPEY